MPIGHKTRIALINFFVSQRESNSNMHYSPQVSQHWHATISTCTSSLIIFTIPRSSSFSIPKGNAYFDGGKIKSNTYKVKIRQKSDIKLAQVCVWVCVVFFSMGLKENKVWDALWQHGPLPHLSQFACIERSL